MNKYLSIIVVLLAGLILPALVFGLGGIGPSFEVGGDAGPSITDINVFTNGNFSVVNATITDVSGIALATIIIKDAFGAEVERIVMCDNGTCQDGASGDDVYGSFVLSASYGTGTFIIDIFADDVFGNETYIANIGLLDQGNICPASGDTYVCASTVKNITAISNCAIDNGVLLCTTLPAPAIIGSETCLSDHDVVLCGTIPSPDIPAMNNCVANQGTVFCTSAPSPQLSTAQNCVENNDAVVCLALPSPVAGPTPVCNTQDTRTICGTITENPAPAPSSTIPTYVTLEVISSSDGGLPYCLPSLTMSVMDGSTTLTSKIVASETCANDLIVSDLVTLTGGTQYSVKLATSSCAGYADASGNCWFGGEIGQTCLTVCSDKGGNKTANCEEIDTDCNASKNIFGIDCSFCSESMFDGVNGFWHFSGFGDSCVILFDPAIYGSTCYTAFDLGGGDGLRNVCACNSPVTYTDFTFPFTAGQ